jgi:AcrR family transcriptional regulator
LTASEEAAARFVAEALPRGRHNLSRERVLASQRTRLLRAMGEMVGSVGYAATTVPDVVAAARVSRNAFYELFNDKADCFIALCDDLANEILDEMVAVGAERGWLAALQAGMRNYLEKWQERDMFTRAYFVELPAAGLRAVEQRDRQIHRFFRLFHRIAMRAREEDPSLPPISPYAVELAVLGTTELIAHEVRQGRVDRLTELEPHLLRYVTMMFVQRPLGSDLAQP